MTLLLGLLVGLAALGDPPCPGGTVLDRDELAAGGVVSLPDLVRLAGLADGISLDGFDAEPLVAWGTPQPVRLLLDDAPVASTAAFEPLGLGPLPVSVREIERVVVCPGPGLAAGRWGGPWMNIETENHGRASVSGALSNETGDPGPDLYRDPALTNVDRWGPYAEAAVGGRVGPGDVWVAARLHELFPTDTTLVRRFFDIRPPGAILNTGAAAALAVRAGGTRARLGLSEARAFTFVPAIAREIPLDRRVVQGTASLHPRVGGLPLRGHLHAAQLSATQTEGGRLAIGPAGTGPDWSERRIDAALSVQATRGDASVAVGVQADAVRVTAPGVVGTETAGRAWVSAARERTQSGLSATVQATVTDAGVQVGADGSFRRRIGPNVEARATVALDRHPPPGRIAPWLRRGYTGLDGSAVTVTVGDAQSATVALARLDLSATPAPGVRLAVGLDAQRSRTEVGVFDTRDADVGVAGTSGIAFGEGTLVRLHAQARWAPGRWTVSAGTRAQVPADGDDVFQDAWDRVPRAQAQLRAAVRPDDRLMLWAALRARSGARWAGFERPDVPAAALLDIGLSKRAWRDHLEFSVIGHNVLDARERTHPLGAVLAPRLFVRATVSL